MLGTFGPRGLWPEKPIQRLNESVRRRSVLDCAVDAEPEASGRPEDASHLSERLRSVRKELQSELAEHDNDRELS